MQTHGGSARDNPVILTFQPVELRINARRAEVLPISVTSGAIARAVFFLEHGPTYSHRRN